MQDLDLSVGEGGGGEVEVGGAGEGRLSEGRLNLHSRSSQDDGRGRVARQSR
jgi:hypothetical protein